MHADAEAAAKASASSLQAISSDIYITTLFTAIEMQK